MAQIKAFRGLRYNKQYAEDMARLTAPPYDVISEQRQRELYEIHSYNVIRLEYGQVFPTDDEDDNRYTRAAAYLRQWMDNGILLQERRPAVYIYQQVFSLDDGRPLTRTGFISLVKLEEFSKGVILPHEYTLSKPKTDRLNLMRACKANFSQIFSLYDDADGSITSILEHAMQQQPDVDFIDSDGIRQVLWAIEEESIINSIQQAMASKQLFIADGHHRYETALALRDEMRRVTGQYDDQQPYDYVMMMMVAMNDPGLVILPTHRIINNMKELQQDKLLDDIAGDFYIQPIDKLDDIAVVLRQCEDDEMPCFAYFNGTGCYLLRLKSWLPVDELLPDKAMVYKHLDVSVLHSLIINKRLGIDEASLAQQTYITYTRDAAEAINSVKSHRAQLAFLLRPTKIEQVKAIALAGEKMPQKSTYFYPKLLTGLVMYKF